MPADNGTEACANARQGLQDANNEAAQHNAALKQAEARVRTAQANLTAAEKRLAANAGNAAFLADVASAKAELKAALADVARLLGNEKAAQTLVNQLAAQAQADCATAQPTPSQTTDELVPPADNGTQECAYWRNRMISLARQIEQLQDNEIRWRDFHPSGPNLYERAIKSRQRQLKAIAPKAAEACKTDFTGDWSGTYQEAPDTCAPSGQTGRMTMTLAQTITPTGTSLSGTLTDYGYEFDCSTADLHATVTGTVTGNTASIKSTYEDGETLDGTLTLKGKTLTFSESAGDTGTLTRG